MSYCDFKVDLFGGHRMTEVFRGFGRGSTLEFSGAL
jgi:hypothetical protein